MMLISLTLLLGSYFIYCVYGSFPPDLQKPDISANLAIIPLYIFVGLGVPCSFLLARGAWYAQAKDTTHSSTRGRVEQTTWTAKVTNACRRSLMRRTSQEEPVAIASHGVFSRRTTVTVAVEGDADEEKGSEERLEVDVSLRRNEGGSFCDEKRLNTLPGKSESIV